MFGCSAGSSAFIFKGSWTSEPLKVKKLLQSVKLSGTKHPTTQGYTPESPSPQDHIDVI